MVGIRAYWKCCDRPSIPLDDFQLVPESGWEETVRGDCRIWLELLPIPESKCIRTSFILSPVVAPPSIYLILGDHATVKNWHLSLRAFFASEIQHTEVLHLFLIQGADKTSIIETAGRRAAR